MKLKKQILTGIGALTFMVVMTLNVQLVQNSVVENAGIATLSSIQLEAQAQGEGNWDEVCCGDLCSGGDHCLGTGTYVCCK